MASVKVCDICDRPATEIPLPASDSTPQFSIDADGLRICYLCKGQIKSSPLGKEHNPDLDEDLKPLVDKSAGAICRTLELPFQPPFQSIIEAASKIAYDQDLYISAWLFADQWMDGTTVWHSADGKLTARVTTDGKVHIEPE
jgi:hypothetical protein